MQHQKEFKVIIVGGGLVGALAALTFARRGFAIELFEKRPDIRTEHIDAGKSINLALSVGKSNKVRGIEALKNAGAHDLILPSVIPMKGRFIHNSNGKYSTEQYDLYGHCINSVDRKFVNQVLLNAADKLEKVNLHFNSLVESIDFKTNQIQIKQDGIEKTVSGDFIIGADGVYSCVRQQMMRHLRMNFSQDYIDHAYVELSIPPMANGDFAMDPEYLHIWPRQSFMMIALPNLDKSFTVTLFMPWQDFDTIRTNEDLLTFFRDKFPDSIPLLGKERLILEFFGNPKGALVSVKCTPYNIGGKTVIVGDAAHAMVPFFGQGMNCGFEDILVLDEIFSRYTTGIPSIETMEQILQDYTKIRRPDAGAICELALQNYITMRSSVVDPLYKLRKHIENGFYRLFPTLVVPLYSMVSFSRISYAQAWKKHQQRTQIFNSFVLVSKVGMWAGVMVVSASIILKLLKNL